MRRISACRQLLIGTSMSLYLPPIGTAGFERVAVNGNNRLPWPPPRMMASVSLVIGAIKASCKWAAVGNHNRSRAGAAAVVSGIRERSLASFYDIFIRASPAVAPALLLSAGSTRVATRRWTVNRQQSYTL